MLGAAYLSSLKESFTCQHTQGQGYPEVLSRSSSEVFFYNSPENSCQVVSPRSPNKLVMPT